MPIKIYHLSTCNTCQRIIKEVGIDRNATDVSLQNIKVEAITATQIEEMAALSGNYESLFSRRSRKYRAMDLHEKELVEADYKKLILEEYTFLKRPVFIIDEQIFIGNTKKVVQAIKEKLT